MSQQPLIRKLAAILYADVAGYCRLTRQDEVSTHHQVMDILDYASETINNSDGTVLRYSGDAILAEFQSVVAAIGTAVEIQNQLSERNTQKTEDEKIRVRIGLNLGEVIEDRGEIFDDGVNLAARLEAAATPGGICISSFVYDQIVDKVEIEFDDHGEETFKNIDKPVQIYQWHPDRVTKNIKPQVLPGKSKKPSIAVLPLANMSGDPEQEFFCDGLTEDIITALSRSSWFNVTSRNSTFAFKDVSHDVREVAQKLGVGDVLEGSVRSQSDPVRINVQLIDAISGNHVWAESFNRERADEFAV